MIKEYLAHILISVDSNKSITESDIAEATHKFEESLSEKLVQDDISDSVVCECTLWEEV